MQTDSGGQTTRAGPVSFYVNQLMKLTLYFCVNLRVESIFYAACKTITSPFRSNTCRDLRGSDDNFLCGDRLSPGAVLCPSQSPVHRCIPGPCFGGSAISTPLQLLDGNVGVNVENINRWNILLLLNSTNLGVDHFVML